MRGIKKPLAFLFILSLLLLAVFPTSKANAAGCRGGNEHDFSAYGLCTVCGIAAAAECNGCYYETPREALAAASAGDTVTLFSDPTQNEAYEIGAGVTLSCEGARIYADVCCRGRIVGGRFYGRVENFGLIEGATLSGELIGHPENETTHCRLEGTARFYGGRITGGSIGTLSLLLSHDSAENLPTIDLRTCDLSEASLRLFNQSAYALSTPVLLPEGYALFHTDGVHNADALASGEAAILVLHTHTPGATLSYNAMEHFAACTACGYRDPDTVSRHLFAYADLGNGAHSACCELCDYTTSLLHEGGAASCTEPALCILCRTPYGEAAPEAHSPSEEGICTRCGFAYPARLGTTLYQTLSEALGVAGEGDTVTLLRDNEEPRLCVPCGVSLEAGGYALSGELANHGALCGGRFYGRVKNSGEINGACLYGGLENEGLVLSATLSSAVDNREGGRIQNHSEGDILLGEGFSIRSDGRIDCRHHTGAPPTCTRQASCLLCGIGYGAPLPHSFLVYHDDGNATCTADGTATALCERCDARDTVIRPNSRTAHKDTDGDGLCNGCRLSLVPPVTATSKAPTTTQAPTTTKRPATTMAPQTSIPVTAAPPEPAVTEGITHAEPSSPRFPLHYALIGLGLGGIAVLLIGKHEN